MMLGSQQKLPIDIVFGVGDKAEPVTTTKSANEMNEILRKVCTAATRNVFAVQKRQKTNYDHNIKGAVLKPGDKV